MSTTDYLLLVDPTTAAASGERWTVTVRAYAAGAQLFQQDGKTLLNPLPQPALTVTVAGYSSDGDGESIERARRAVEAAHQQQLRETALAARLQGFAGRAVPVTVNDA